MNAKQEKAMIRGRVQKIVTNNYIKDESLELRILEDSAQRFMYGLAFVGSVLIALAMLW